MDTNAENAIDRLSESDQESSAVSSPESTGLVKEAANDFFVENGIEARVDVSPALQMMVDELGNVKIALHAYLADNSARLKVFEIFRDAVDASVQKVSQRGETLKEILQNVGNVLDTFSNTEELPKNMDDIVLETIESYSKLREYNPRIDESLCLIAEVHQVVAERKNTKSYIKRFCDYLRGTVMESLLNSQPQSNDTGEDSIDPILHEDKYDCAGDQNDEDGDPAVEDYDDGYCGSYAINDVSILHDAYAALHTNGKISGKYNFIRKVSEDVAFTRAQYENCAVVFSKMGQPFRSLSSESSNNTAISRALSLPGENYALWFLDSMWYPSSESATRDLERLKNVSGKTYHLREIFGHLTEKCLAYVDLFILERIGTVYQGTEDKKFLDFVTKFIMKNYFVPRNLRQLPWENTTELDNSPVLEAFRFLYLGLPESVQNFYRSLALSDLAIPSQTSLALLDPLHPGLYRGLELHLHFPCLSTEEDANWMMDVCRKLVHKFPCELRDVPGFYFKECRLPEPRVKDFMKFLDGEFPKTKIVCIDCDQQTDEACVRQQRLYGAMGFTYYDKAEDGLLNRTS